MSTRLQNTASAASIALLALAATFVGGACAQSAPASPDTATAATPTPPPAGPALSIEVTADPQLERIEAAIEAAQRGQFDAARFGDLADHPLYRWVEYASLHDGIEQLSPSRAQDFLQRHAGEAVADTFREPWLQEVAERQDWSALLAAWQPTVERTDLRCAWLQARQATAGVDAAWVADAQALWSAAGSDLPRQCEAPIALLEARGGLTEALRWQRIELAARAGHPAAMRDAASGLPAEQRALADEYAAFLQDPNRSALDWPVTDRSRLIASLGLARLARDNPDAAEAQLPLYADALEFSEADRGRVLYQIALWTVASYLPESQRRLQAVPAVSMDERLHEWKVRGALARSDWADALAAIREMSDAQRSDSKYEYFAARLAELTGDNAAAQRLYQRAAREPEFHGFLAADRIDQPYALCPWQIEATAAEVAAVARDPAIVRAMRLHQLGQTRWAIYEWHDALQRFDDKRDRIAVAVAQAYGWYIRAIFTLGQEDNDDRELQLYTLRFPLDHAAIIRREAARNRLDPAWVAAEIRAESVFDPTARSGADARGLMQVLPGTGAAVSRRLGRPWQGAQSLYQPETNIVLGTAYLRQMLDEYGGRPYFAIAGYNAGPGPLRRWQADRPGMAADFWIETISYHETRDYVPRVLAFSVIYDWLLDGDALRLSDRIQGNLDGPRKGFACPAPVADAAAPAAGG